MRFKRMIDKPFATFHEKDQIATLATSKFITPQMSDFASIT